MIGRERKKREAEKREAVGVSAGVQNFKSADWDNGAMGAYPSRLSQLIKGVLNDEGELD